MKLNVKKLSKVKIIFTFEKILFSSIIAAGILVLIFAKWTDLKPRIEAQTMDKIFEEKDYKNFERFSSRIGVDRAYREIKKKFPNNDAQAHDFAHVIGIVSFQNKGLKGLNLCDTAYNYGCFHGFIEAFLAQEGVGEVGEIEKTCISFGFVHAPSCLHGIGHGLLINTSYQLEDALADCQKLTESSRIYCYDGVFMERVVASMQTIKKNPIDPEDIYAPCQLIDAIYKSQCWRNQVYGWLDLFRSDSKKVIFACSQIEVSYQEVCLESLGYNNVMRAGENRSTLISLCTNNLGNISDLCLVGELKELLFEGKTPQIAQSLCAEVSAENLGKCQEIFRQQYDQYMLRFRQ